MDPNTTLARIRELLHATREGTATGVDAEELVELVGAMDGWLSGGGFLPAAWAVYR